ncbi:MAG: tRNA (cytidine(34)-2'-O)-methyltransferase [Eggerthellales bacterium]|nr:tRNA (cytidine(34)-2'-O)-methyltransferase [Eggerthellales bacterium]
MAAPFNIVLIEPEIPQNTGNIARTCAITGATLHLVEPMGFRLSSKQLSRSGCDYWDDVEIVRWACAADFFAAHGDDELHLFTGKASDTMAEVAYNPGCYLLFGRESRGIDEEWLQAYAQQCVRIPMRPDQRSLNLSNAVAIASYEALRQAGYPGLE